MMANETDWVKEIGEPALASVREMVAALGCDYGRLADLRDERDDWEPGADEDEGPDQPSWADEYPEDAAELAALEAAAGDCTDADDARRRIEEDALSVEGRSAWTALGEDLTPDEFVVLLATGGPAARIRGELAHGEPSRAWLEVQDWGKPWTEYHEPGAGDVLLAYSRVFCFGA